VLLLECIHAHNRITAICAATSTALAPLTIQCAALYLLSLSCNAAKAVTTTAAAAAAAAAAAVAAAAAAVAAVAAAAVAAAVAAAT
jgi:hypothetical protein